MAAYWLRKYGWTVEHALAVIKSRRPTVQVTPLRTAAVAAAAAGRLAAVVIVCVCVCACACMHVRRAPIKIPR